MPNRLLICAFCGLWSISIELARASIPAVVAEEVVADGQGLANINVLVSTSGYPISAAQFDIEYPDSIASVSPSLDQALVAAGKHLATSQPQPLRVRVLIYGFDQKPIDDGVVITLAVQIKTDAPPGRYPISIGNVVLSDPVGNAVFAQTINGALIVAGGSTYIPTVSEVVNGASYSPGPVAPGEIVVIRGDWLTSGGSHKMQLTANGVVANSLAGTRVLFDGLPAPLIYTATRQISAIVPYSVDGATETALQVECLGYRSTGLRIPVARSFPGIFTQDSSGKGQASASNSDGTVNNIVHPVPRGSIVSVFATGEGQTAPAGSDGSIAGESNLRRPILPVTALVGGQDAEVLYAGSAGGQVAGLLQVNLRVPDGLQPGPAVPVVIKIGDTSQPGVTLAIQ